MDPAYMPFENPCKDIDRLRRELATCNAAIAQMMRQAMSEKNKARYSMLYDEQRELLKAIRACEEMRRKHQRLRDSWAKNSPPLVKPWQR